jgi:hypothetical protein
MGRRVTSFSERWPAAERPSDVWCTVPLRDVEKPGRALLTRLRQVRLWGADVLVDAAGAVYCDSCWRTVPVADLGRPNSHHTGAVALGPLDGALQPMSADDREPPPDRSFLAMRW